jgi:predicted acetyltransferase
MMYKVNQMKKFDVGIKEITIYERPIEMTISDKVIKDIFQVVLDIYTLAQVKMHS